jgi:hypothetical protein
VLTGITRRTEISSNVLTSAVDGLRYRDNEMLGVVMNCREFENLWNDFLDFRCEPPAHLERDLEAHALGCSRCLAVSSRYQLLRQAISTLRPPTPSAESIERLHAMTALAKSSTIPIGVSKRRLRLLGPLAAAASFALAWLGGGWWPSHQPAERTLRSVETASGTHQALGLALANATEATLDLARGASAPASRIGREMLDLGKSPTSPEPESVDLESASSDLFKAVGERVGAGVRPISGSARHAFSFLLGPPDEPDPTVPAILNSL